MVLIYKSIPYFCAMHTFYTTQILNNEALLNEEESLHASRVLRLQLQTEVKITDGKGILYSGLISDLNKRKVRISLLNKTEGWDKNLTLPSIAIAPTKNIDRFEWFLEKATELGVGNIYPILCSRSERIKINLERLNKIVVSAVKQSQRSVVPTLHPLQKFTSILTESYAHKYIGFCEDEKTFDMNEVYNFGKSLIFIGPEGDFTDDEINKAVEHMVKPVTFGRVRLRTETAGIYVCMAHSLGTK